MGALGLVLLEVMDKELAIPQLWVTFLFLGIAAAWLARGSVVASLCVGSLIVLMAMGQHAELTDPFVGPAIRQEAGPWYAVHSYAAVAVALAMCLGSCAWTLATRVHRRSTAPATAV
jgi:hypothetical protein